MEKVRKLVIAIIFFIGLFSLGTNVLADDTASGFGKKVQHPDNQITDGEALNLMMKPGQKQKVTVLLENYGAEATTIEVKIAGAKTNGSGGLEYAPSPFKSDKSMKYDLTDLVNAPSEIDIPGNGKADLILDIQMPENAYDGIVTGGIQLMEKGKNIGTTEENGSVITNKFAFLFGVTLRMNETKVTPDFDLRSVKAGLSNYRNAILVDIGNIQPFLAENMSLSVEIMERGKQDVLFQKKTNNISFAPNSLMSYPVSLDGEKMTPGKFTADIILRGYDDEWRWKEDFSISKEEADKFNQQDPYLVQERGLNWQLILIIVGSLLLLIILLIIVLKVIKEKNKEKRKASKEKAKRHK